MGASLVRSSATGSYMPEIQHQEAFIWKWPDKPNILDKQEDEFLILELKLAKANQAGERNKSSHTKAKGGNEIIHIYIYIYSIYNNISLSLEGPQSNGRSSGSSQLQVWRSVVWVVNVSGNLRSCYATRRGGAISKAMPECGFLRLINLRQHGTVQDKPPFW